MNTPREYKTHVRVRYAETDQMGYVYYGRYTEYFEVARVEAIRELGFSYKKLEEEGFMLPVAKVEIKYISPIHYDEKIQLRTTVQLIGASFIRFETKVYSENNVHSTTGSVTLCFVDSKTRQPIRPPEELIAKLK